MAIHYEHKPLRYKNLRPFTNRDMLVAASMKAFS